MLDLVSSIPAIGFLRVGRLARIARILRVLRGARSLRALLGLILRSKGELAFTTAALVCTLLLVFASIAILHVEDAEKSNIKTPEEAFWWACVTMTTVGYGDFYPVTTEGRIIAGFLMVAGVGFFGTFTGFVASSFVTPREVAEEHQIAELRRELAEIKVLLTREGDGAGK